MLTSVPMNPSSQTKLRGDALAYAILTLARTGGGLVQPPPP